MYPMGALQSGIPSPVALPQSRPMIVIDLQDCFFTIPVHPEDKKQFAFSLPQINHCGPHHQFQWKTLPHGMINSPLMCQLYIDAALNPVCRSWPHLYISHYMEDILFARPDIEELESLLKVFAHLF